MYFLASSMALNLYNVCLLYASVLFSRPEMLKIKFFLFVYVKIQLVEPSDVGVLLRYLESPRCIYRVLASSRMYAGI